MQARIYDTTLTNKLRIIFSIVLLEYLLFVFSGVSFSFLHGNGFFSIEADPAFWIFYLARIPQFITANQWAGILLDSTIVSLLLLFIRNPFDNRIAIILFILLLLFYVTLMGHLAHHNYQFGFVILFIPFMFKKDMNKSFAFEAIRFFLLFFYVSAALLKLWSNALTNEFHLSHLICGQFTPYYLEANTGLRTDANLFLITHPAFSYALYFASVILELVVIIGFFTNRFDKWLVVLILAFHFSNWFLMDIAPFGQIAFVCMLFLSKKMRLT